MVATLLLWIRQFFDLKSKEVHPFVQFARYAFCGGIAFLVHIAIFTLIGSTVLDAFTEDNPNRTRDGMISFTLAFLLANFVAYGANVVFVFKDGKFSRATETLLFFGVSFIAFLLGLALYRLLEPTMVGWLGATLGPQITNLSNVFTAAIVNYAARKFFIFKG